MNGRELIKYALVAVAAIWASNNIQAVRRLTRSIGIS